MKNFIFKINSIRKNIYWIDKLFEISEFIRYVGYIFLKIYGFIKLIEKLGYMKENVLFWGFSI